MEVVGLMGIAEGIETEVFHQFDAGLDLLVAEGMALTEEVLILTGAVDEDGSAVEPEPLVAVIPGLGPGGGTDAVGRVGALHCFSLSLDDGIDTIEIGMRGAPQDGGGQRGLLMDQSGLSGSQGEILRKPDDLFAALLAEFVDQFYLHRLLTMVFHFCFDVQWDGRCQRVGCPR